MPDYRPALEQFRALPQNWNSYGGVPTTQIACEVLLRVAEQIPEGYSACAIVPTPAGGVQLEWHRGGLDAELEVGSPGHVVCYVDAQGWEQQWYGEDEVPHFVRFLREHLPIPVEC